jgi:hypothetical protein
MDESRVLLFNFPQDMIGLRMGLLARPPFVVDPTTQAGELARLLETVAYRLIILCLPVPGLEFEGLFSLIRGEGRKSARCILMATAEDALLESLKPRVGRGLNALLPRSVSAADLEAEIARQIQVAPRSDARVMARLRARLVRTSSSLICQTGNISSTGMFLVSKMKLPVSTSFEFELAIPRLKLPVAGEGRVVRHAATDREKMDGMGAAFLAFKADGRQQLLNFLAAPPGMLQV